jgi:DNA polymerase-4
VEPLSIDEAFLDVGGSTRLFGPVETIAQRIKLDIMHEERLVASVGVAPNKFLAKLASDLSKPDGFLALHEADIEAFLCELPVSRLWGVGKQTTRQLEALGLRTIGQLAQWPEAQLAKRFGHLGSHIWHLAHGIDDRPVTPHRATKTIGAETTFTEDTADVEVLRRTLLELAEKVGRRFRADGVMATKVTLKYRDADFVTLTRTQALAEPTAVALDLYQAASTLFSLLPGTGRKVRLLGIAATELTPVEGQQLSLFSTAMHKRLQAERAEDAIRARFGSKAITRAALLELEERRRDFGSS